MSLALAWMTTSTTGTGTITLGTFVEGMLTFDQAGIPEGKPITYGIADANGGREVAEGVYTASGLTLTRTTISSSNNNNPLDLSGEAQVFVLPAGIREIGEGLELVDGVLLADIASQGEAEAGTDNIKLMTPLRTAQAIEELAGGDPVAGQWVEVNRAVADNDAAIDFTGIDDSADEWMIQLIGVKATAEQTLRMRTSSDGGSSFDDESGDYAGWNSYEIGGVVNADHWHGNLLDIGGYWWGIGLFGLSGELLFTLPHVANRNMIRGWTTNYTTGSTPDKMTPEHFSGRRMGAVINAVQLFMAGTTNIESGTFVLLKRIK